MFPGAVDVPYAEVHRAYFAGVVSPADYIVYALALFFGLRMGVMWLLRTLWRAGVDRYAEGYENDPERCTDAEFRTMQAYAATHGPEWRQSYYTAKALWAAEGVGLQMVDGRRVSGGIPRKKGRSGRRKVTSRDLKRELRTVEKKGYQHNWQSKYRRR